MKQTISDSWMEDYKWLFQYKLLFQYKSELSLQNSDAA